MNSELKHNLEEISDCFYQERAEDGVSLFMNVVALMAQTPECQNFLNPLFDAIEQGDYLLSADLIYHEMLKK